MAEVNDTTDQRVRTDWDARLVAACEQYAARGKIVTATTMKYPPNPALVVRFGDALSSTPYTFPTAKAAALKLESWLEAPQ